MAEPRSLTLDDLFSLEHVVDVQLSPDGTQVAFALRRDYTEGERTTPDSNIWLVPWDGTSLPRRVTYGPRADTSPRWSPDGTQLAFLSDREEADKLQLYTLPLNGGEARCLTSAKAGVVELKWAPDGREIAFLAPDSETEEEEERKRERDDAIHVDHDHKCTRLWVVAPEGGEARSITPPSLHVRSFAWYQNGWAIVTSATPREDDWVYPMQLQLVREGQSVQSIWEIKHGNLGVVGSPDGQALAWIHSGADAQDSVDELWALIGDAEPRRVTSDYAGGLVWTDWMPDGKALLVAATESTRTALGRVSLSDGMVETILQGRTLSEGFLDQPRASVSRDGQRIACVLEDGTQPRDVWTGTLGGDLRRVTSFNAHLQDVALGKVETVRWSAPDGLGIEGVLIYPAGYEAGQRYPLVVQIHGGPTWQWLQRFMLSWHDWGQWLAAHGYAVLLPNPRGSTGRGREFAHRNRRAWGIGDFDDVLSGVDALIERGVVDGERLGIGGWSYGGYLTAWAIGHTDRFKAAVVGAGVTNLVSFQAADIPSWLPNDQMLASPVDDPEIYARCSPISYVGAVRTPTLVLHGDKDERVRLGQGRELYHALRARQVPTEMVVYPRERHIINERHHQRDLLQRVLRWFDQWLQKTPRDSR